MSRSYVIYIGLLAAFWGASYMFIKVAGRAFEPATMMMLRLALAFSLLLVVLAAQRGWSATVADMRGLGWEGFALGIVNGAIPFTLIAWGEKHIDSGVAAIANASMPIFVVLLAIRFKPSETVRGLRLVGFLVGLVGVGVLAGVHPQGGWWGVAGTLAVVVASVSYAVGSLWGQRLIHRTSGLVLSASSMLGGLRGLMRGEAGEQSRAGVRRRGREGLLEEIERSQAEPEEYGRFVIEVDGEPAGLMGFQVANKRSRIANLGSLAVHPRFRGRRVADEAARLFQRHLFDLGYHRLQLEIYGFNKRAMRHAERAGWIKEGVRRKAYDRHGEWVDGVIYGLVLEDVDD